MGIASKEIRELAVKAYLAGKGTAGQLAEIFCCHEKTLLKWVREFKEDGRLEPLPRGHMSPAYSPKEREELAELVEKYPDATLERLRELSKKDCSLVTVYNTVTALGFRFKKNSEGRRAKSRGRHQSEG